MNNITKTPREISSIMEIEERFLSLGDRKIQGLHEKGVITIPTMLRPLQDYLDQTFPSLNIPNKFKRFVYDIIERAENMNIHIMDDSRPTTKCIGAIFLIINRVPIQALKHINTDTIVKECKISKSTFMRYYKLLIANYPKLKPVFKKHKIPMPSYWRTNIINKSNKKALSKKERFKSPKPPKEIKEKEKKEIKEKEKKEKKDKKPKQPKPETEEIEKKEKEKKVKEKKEKENKEKEKEKKEKKPRQKRMPKNIETANQINIILSDNIIE
jgi:flagellar biosynthesis GTPase FlhF